MSTPEKLLTTTDLNVGYSSRGGSPALIAGPLSLSVAAGQLTCLLGPNGAGKSTLLRTLAGLQPPLAGKIWITGEQGAHQLSPQQLAKKISLVLTDPVRYSNLRVHALVALGRYPWSGWLGKLSPEDHRIISRAMEVTGITSYADKKIGMLSDGESQKVMLARALAQDTPLMMLDEPTAHLDLPSRIHIMQLLHRLARTTQKGILLSTHELDLALQVADEIWLLQANGSLEIGVPEALVLDGTFASVFNKEGILFDENTGAFHIHAGSTRNITLTGTGPAAFWTRRALQREGFSVTDGNEITVQSSPAMIWTWTSPNGEQKFTQIAGLLKALREIYPR